MTFGYPMPDDAIATLEHILVGSADLTPAELAYVIGDGLEIVPPPIQFPPAA